MYNNKPNQKNIILVFKETFRMFINISYILNVWKERKIFFKVVNEERPQR